MSAHPTSAELREALTRFDAESRTGHVLTPHYRLPYVTWGDPAANPVVFIHGMADLPRSFAMVMSWLVEAGFYCIAYDLADGRGDRANLGMYRHTHFADDLFALLDHLKLPVVDVVGSSFGTTIAIRALATAPRRFRRAVLQGGFARRPLRWIERGLARLARFWPWRMDELIIRERVMARLEAGQFDGCQPEIFRFLLHNSGRTPCRAAALRTLIIDKLDLRPLLPRIIHPVLMIGGDIDHIVPVQYQDELENGLKDVRRVIFRPCGHYPQYTMPRRMAEEITGFCSPPREESANIRAGGLPNR